MWITTQVPDERDGLVQVPDEVREKFGVAVGSKVGTLAPTEISPLPKRFVPPTVFKPPTFDRFLLSSITVVPFTLIAILVSFHY